MKNIYPLFAERNDYGKNIVCDILKMRGDVALDIGSNNGGFLDDLLARFKSVHAFEPVKDQFDLLRKFESPKLKLNLLALSNKCGRLENVNVFNTWSLLPDDSDVVGKSIEYVEKEPFSVDVSTVDDYCGALLTPDYIKLDVDGFEPFVLEGARKTLNRRKCPIYMEYSYLPERFFNYSKEKMVNLIYDMGYEAHSVDGLYCAESPEKMLECYPYHTSYDVMLVHVDY